MNSRGHVLVAEDNPALLGVIALSLRNTGFEVTTAGTGMEAWEFLEANDVDLVLADFNMPGITGGSLCEAMKSHPRHRETPMILLTALSADVQRDHCFQSLGVAALIHKPFSPRDVTAKVDEILRRDRQLSTTPGAVSSDVTSTSHHD